MQYQYISADNHVDSRWLPKNLWQDRIAAKYKADAPKIIETPKGSVWSWEGQPRGEAADGSAHERLANRFFPNQNLPKGALPPSDPKYLLAHMDLASIYAGVYYADTRKWEIESPELKLEVYRVYNDFVMETNSHSPDRILLLPNLPTALPEACPAELQRMIKAGAKAVEFGVFDVGQPIFDPIWHPVFTMAAEAGVTLCTHIGDRAGTPYPPLNYGASLAHYSIAPFSIARQIPQFVFSGAFERNPTLKVSFAECRIGWLPFLISWMDRQVHERPADPTAPLSMLPSEYIKRNVTFTFEEDYLGAKLLTYDWAYIKDSAIWGADYPHEQGVWPSATVALEKMLDGLSPELKREILFDRSARVFNIQGGR